MPFFLFQQHVSITFLNMIGTERKTEIPQMESMYVTLYEWYCKVL